MILLLERLNESFRRACKTTQFSGLSVCIKNESDGSGAMIGRWINPDDVVKLVKKHKPTAIVFEGFKPTEQMIRAVRVTSKAGIYIRIHSNIPFLTQERGFFAFLDVYRRLGATVIYNDDRAFEALKDYCPSKYLPNIYNVSFLEPIKRPERDTLDVASFGSIRPLKNQVTQALAAILLANKLEKKLQFHVNLDRCEGGQKEAAAIHQLFSMALGHRLVSVPWMEHGAFLTYMNRHIDLGLQVSLTESFNITSADYTAAGIPMVVSNEVRWAPNDTKVQDNGCATAIAEKAMDILARRDEMVTAARKNLREFSDNAIKLWRTANL